MTKLIIREMKQSELKAKQVKRQSLRQAMLAFGKS